MRRNNTAIINAYELYNGKLKALSINGKWYIVVEIEESEPESVERQLRFDQKDLVVTLVGEGKRQYAAVREYTSPDRAPNLMMYGSLKSSKLDAAMLLI